MIDATLSKEEKINLNTVYMFFEDELNIKKECLKTDFEYSESSILVSFENKDLGMEIEVEIDTDNEYFKILVISGFGDIGFNGNFNNITDALQFILNNKMLIEKELKEIKIADFAPKETNVLMEAMTISRKLQGIIKLWSSEE